MTDLSNLKKLTNELAQEIHGNMHQGPLFGLMTEYFNKFETFIAVTDKNRKVLFLNDSVKKRISDLGHDPEKFIDAPCIGLLTGGCTLKDHCPVVDCVNDKKVKVRNNINGPISDKIYTLVCMPLKYNGVSAVIEMWIEVE